MSKLLKSSLAALMAVALVGCSSQPAAGGNTGGGDDTQGSKVSIGFVSDVGGIDDKSFNQTSWEGIKKFADENGLKEGSDYSFLQSNNEADYIPNLSAFADKGVDLIAAAGFMFGDAITETVNAYPNQKILIIDVDWLEGENLQQAVFAEHEGSYLVGVVAGLKAMENGSKHVGMVIGQESESMFRFWAGYQQGVWAVCPDCIISYDNADNFTSPEKGQSLAQKQYNAGATVIFACAGSTGNGVIKEASERRGNGEDVWVIGVDTDQYSYGVYGDGSQSSVLTSMMKRVDVATYNACKQVADGTFKGGVVRYTLADGGVGLPAENPNLTDDVLATVKDYTDKIVSGEVKVESTPVVEKGSSDLTVGW